jgi:anaerobic dimethyl sulfoxide reductase subunit B (iron-sulfur subunit)
MTQLGFFFDADRCVSCKSCIMACKDKNNTLVGVKFRSLVDIGGGSWVDSGGLAIPQGVYVYGVSYSCMHCAAPACIPACPVGAISKRDEDGVVLIEQGECIGCGSCTAACPYSAPRLLSDKGVYGKCDFCREYLEEGGSPACVDACLMRCLEFGEIEHLREVYGDTAQIGHLASPDMTMPSYVARPHRMDDGKGVVINADEELL